MLSAYRNELLVKRESLAGDYVPYTAHIDENTVKLRQGDFIQCFRLEGIAHETADDDDINTWHEQLNMFMRNINSPHIALYTHIIRKQSGEYVGGKYEPGFAHDLNEKYRKKVSSNNLFVNELYLTLLYRPQPMALARAFSKVDELSAQGRAQMNSLGIDKINALTKELEKHLNRYSPERLTTYEFKGNVYSEVLEFLQFLVNGYEQRFPLMRGNIQDTLVTSRPLFGREAMEFRAPDRSLIAAVLGIKEYPHPTVPGLFNELLHANYEFVLSQSFICLDKASARTTLKRQRDRLESTEDDATQQVDELADALNDLQSNKFTMGEHHLTLLIKADNVKALSNNIGEARAALADSGCVVAREDLALEAAFWSQLPGNFNYRPRPAPITSYNFVGMSAFHNYPTGKRTGNHWGDAVALLKTTSGAPYFFNYHRRDLGITFLCGQSGTGKTATQNFLSCMAEKFQATGIYFDKDRGSEIFILANGGKYFSLQTGIPTGFNPFALPKTPRWVDTLRRIIMACTRRDDLPFTSREERDITQAIEGVFGLSHGVRRFNQILSFLEPPEGDNIASRLLKWCHSDLGTGPLAWVFDNPVDLLDVKEGRLFGFDYTDFLDNPEVRTPIMMYLWSRFAELIDGRRLYMFIDEFWKALEDEYFQDELQNRYKTIRKQNWFLICATQSPADALRSKIAHTVIEQTATFIYLPNPQAKETDYTEGFNLTDREYQIIKTLPETSRQFLVKQGQNAVICELDLQGFEDELAVLSGTTANINLAESIIKKVGNDPTVWLPHFYEHRSTS
ncbi:VirB4 family type IV secretion/conjugal transfer ATPase [Sulfurirhabdus autotrophica]|uniref:Type IV secretion system protein VirB4 n=1 Tax=Sulfurirhabdus autotrophica TaxID=1706046 RepID=A0A4R3XWV1_9PROT|nr:VirB4 family type IV secretion/conjugal transfer ATPase [Sulfurirhabdus autotrophica]TCV82738.1 type IV secretion system protein VirB4 [Sulfurirhabdus autotrophica]